MVVGLTFVINQMTPYQYIKAGRSKNHFAPCHHFTTLSPTTSENGGQRLITSEKGEQTIITSEEGEQTIITIARKVSRRL